MLQKIKVAEKNTEGRVESGAVQFEDKMGQLDWPGLFIRGDDAFGMAMAIQAVDDHLKEKLGPDIEKQVWYVCYFKQLLAWRSAILEEVVIKSSTKESNED